MRQELELRLKSPVNFPSPPGVAQRIIQLAQDPEADVGRIAEAIGQDPGLTAKILRTANSPLYVQRRRSQNLRQAVLVLGLNATTTLALSFSIVASLKSSGTRGIDYPAYWRRSLLAAMASRAVGEALGLLRGEDLFLAGLLQDIGILALDRSKPGFYAELPRNADTGQLLAYERERTGEDHAAIGAWLLNNWNLPEHLCGAVGSSHRPEQAGSGSESGRFARCVAFAGELAEMLLSPHKAKALNQLTPRGFKLLGLRREQLGEVLSEIARLAPETEQLFDMNILDAEGAGVLMEQAREILAMRSLQSLSEIDTLRQTTDSLVARTEALEDASRHDGLTSLFNRAYLDQRIGGEFDGACKNGWPLSIAFIDLDHFKRINDNHGHQVGDQVLRSTARLLLGSVRNTDVVARYGGEEFVALFPGLDYENAHSACERILATLRATTHKSGERSITATASIGIATHSPQVPFADVSKLVHAADMALYAAKRGGRDRIEAFLTGTGGCTALAG